MRHVADDDYLRWTEMLVAAQETLLAVTADDTIPVASMVDLSPASVIAFLVGSLDQMSATKRAVS